MVESGRAKQAGVEWRTVAIAAAIYGGWFATILANRQMPSWFTLTALSVLLAWHGSLQHEVLHGHPFRNKRANDALGSLPLSPRLPYLAYRRYHLEHHASTELTCPIADVESYYLTVESWGRLHRVGKAVAIAHQTLAGRMILGPPLETAGVWRWQLREIRNGDRQLARYWAGHLAAFALVATFVLVVADLPLWVFAGGIYLGHGLGLVRSFCEHRWEPDGANRSAVVRAGWFFSLLFLNNNLHHTHHARPGAAWYRLPALADELESDAAAAIGAGLYSGYFDVARRHMFRPVNRVVHPMHLAIAERSEHP